ncbi:MAG: hypothetical protein R3D29_16490 [Nitratireductor sp.]
MNLVIAAASASRRLSLASPVRMSALSPPMMFSDTGIAVVILVGTRVEVDIEGRFLDIRTVDQVGVDAITAVKPVTPPPLS